MLLIWAFFSFVTYGLVRSALFIRWTWQRQQGQGDDQSQNGGEPQGLQARCCRVAILPTILCLGAIIADSLGLGWGDHLLMTLMLPVAGGLIALLGLMVVLSLLVTGAGLGFALSAFLQPGARRFAVGFGIATMIGVIILAWASPATPGAAAAASVVARHILIVSVLFIMIRAVMIFPAMMVMGTVRRGRVVARRRFRRRLPTAWVEWGRVLLRRYGQMATIFGLLAALIIRFKPDEGFRGEDWLLWPLTLFFAGSGAIIALMGIGFIFCWSVKALTSFKAPSRGEARQVQR